MVSNRQQQKGESMGNLEFHKGSFCAYSSIFCQEGYCSACEIYLQRQVNTKPTEHHDNLREIGKLQETGIRGRR
jgi:hypothetical protein